jgi:RNA polymerase sigma-70 factor (ECF subfamily)
VTAQVRDRAIADRLAAGDETALREAYRAYAGAVFGLALRVTTNRAIAEDVTQDVFVRVWEQPQQYDPARGPLRAYLLAMTHSRAVERVRSEDARRRRQETAQREATRAPVTVDPQQAVIGHDVGVAVRDALAALPDSQRIPIEMAYFDGLSYRQVASELDEPEGTVKYRIRIGMQKLRAALRAVEVAP